MIEDLLTNTPGDETARVGRWSGGRGSDGGRCPVPAGLREDAARVQEACRSILLELEGLLGTLPSGLYTQRVPEVFNASIGAHVRHSLDHFTSLERGVESGLVDYDGRDRDLRIEEHPEFAAAVARGLRARLDRMAPESLAQPIPARCEVSYAPGQSPVVQSTLGRELVYAVAHAIHHFALIRVMATLACVPLPAHFGVAPSTAAHLAREAARR